MPFTLSHAAAVLPLARTRLPVAALVAGSVAPDLPYYLPLPVAAATAHGPAGLWADVLFGGAALVLYVYVLRAPLYALAGIASAPAAPIPRSLKAAARSAGPASVALALGAATHMAWDSFTQTGGALVRTWSALSVPVVGPHLVHNVLMYASSAVGLAVVAWWAHRTRASAALSAKRPDGQDPSGPGVEGQDADRRARTVGLAAVMVCAVAAAGLYGMSERAAVSGYDLVRCLLVGALTGAALGLAVWVAVWWVRLRPRPTGL